MSRIRPSHCSWVLLGLSCLVMTISAAASLSGPVLQLSQDSGSEEIELFHRFAVELAGDSDNSIAQLGDAGLQMIAMRDSRNVEDFVAAQAVYHHRLKEMSDSTLELVELVEERVLEGIREPFQKLVSNGCETFVICHEEEVIKSCSCTNPYGSCWYSTTTNNFGGAVYCNCAGSLFDVHRLCKPANTCDPVECALSCGGPGQGDCDPGDNCQCQ